MAETRDMPAGRELDARIVGLMGWRRSDDPDELEAALFGADETCWTIDDDGRLIVARPYRGGEWNPSTDIAAAWEVVEAMKDRPGEICEWLGFYIDTITREQERGYAVAFGRYTAWADTAPLAICRAALAAVGGRS